MTLSSDPAEDSLSDKDRDIMQKYFLGLMLPSEAETRVLAPGDFRVYRHLEINPRVFTFSDLKVVHRHYNGAISHYPIECLMVNGLKRYYVKCGPNPTEKHFASVLTLIKYHKYNYILAPTYCDVFPEVESDDSTTDSEEADF